MYFLAGMHRSGTSLTAMWLEKCGFYLGDNVLSGAWDNKYGHFENKELLAFAKQILATRGIDDKGLKLEENPKVTFTIEEREHLNLIISDLTKNKNNFLWKEPRTTLWIEELIKSLSDLKIIAVYRSFHQVADSLFRRERKQNPFPKRKPIHWLNWIFKYKLKKDRIFEAYLKDWILYNNSILAFHSKYPEKIIMFNLEQVVSEPKNILESIKSKFDLKLDLYPINAVLDSKIISTSANLRLDSELILKAEKIYNELEARTST